VIKKRIGRFDMSRPSTPDIFSIKYEKLNMEIIITRLTVYMIEHDEFIVEPSISDEIDLLLRLLP